MNEDEIIQYISTFPRIEESVLYEIVNILAEKQFHKIIVTGSRCLQLIEDIGLALAKGVGEYDTKVVSLRAELQQSFRRVYSIYRSCVIGGNLSRKEKLVNKHGWNRLANHCVERMMKEYR